MDFALICRDAPGSLERRLAARAEHMAGLRVGKADGTIVDGGAILDADGNMAGSVVLCRFPDRVALDDYLAREVYSREGIWGDIEILEMRFVDWTKRIADRRMNFTRHGKQFGGFICWSLRDSWLDEQTDRPATYKIRNWPAYDEALTPRASLTLWFDPEMNRDAAATGRGGRQLSE